MSNKILCTCCPSPSLCFISLRSPSLHRPCPFPPPPNWPRFPEPDERRHVSVLAQIQNISIAAYNSISQCRSAKKASEMDQEAAEPWRL